MSDLCLVSPVSPIDPEHLDFYATELAYYEQTYISLAVDFKMHGCDYLEKPYPRMANLVLSLCSDIESLVKDFEPYVLGLLNPLEIAKITDGLSSNSIYYGLALINNKLHLSERKIKINTDVVPIEYQKSYLTQPLKYAHLTKKQLDAYLKEERENKEKEENGNNQNNNEDDEAYSSRWYMKYNKIKHDRFQSLKDSTCLLALQILGAFYLLLVYARYLPNTLPKMPFEAPVIGTFPLEEIKVKSLLFSPTIARFGIKRFHGTLSNAILENREQFSTSMFLIRESENLFQLMRKACVRDNKHIEKTLTNNGLIRFLNSLQPELLKDINLQSSVILNVYDNNHDHDDVNHDYSGMMLYNYPKLNKINETNTNKTNKSNKANKSNKSNTTNKANA